MDCHWMDCHWMDCRWLDCHWMAWLWMPERSTLPSCIEQPPAAWRPLVAQFGDQAVHLIRLSCRTFRSSSLNCFALDGADLSVGPRGGSGGPGPPRSGALAQSPG